MLARRVVVLSWFLGACSPTDEGPAQPPQDAALADAATAITLDSGRLDAGTTLDASPSDAARPSAKPDAAPDAPVDDAITHYQLDWLGGIDGGFVTHASIEIDASVERVWQLVRDVNRYESWCSVLSADAGTVAPGAPIHLEIQLDDPPAAPTASDEQITVVDDARHAIAWSRDFGFGQATLRYQIVTPSPLGARYTTALRYPNELGSIVIPLLGPNLDRAFQTIAKDLARAAR